MEQIYEFINKNQEEYVKLLAETVAIPSVSASAEMRPHVFKMCKWIEAQLTRLGASYELRHPGKQTLEGKEVDLPPIILAKYGSDPSKKTVLVYGHYDVQPALKSDGWNTDPWTLTEDDRGRMFGRGIVSLITGSSDDKGPVISWMWVIDVHQKLGLEMPVNLKMCFEGMEESGIHCLTARLRRSRCSYFRRGRQIFQRC